MHLLIALNIISSIGVALFGFNSLILTYLFLRHYRKRDHTPVTPEDWPSVVVQVPVYNERYVVKRVIDSVAALKYPAECLEIQILDDSDDETTAIAQKQIDHYRNLGVNIQLVRRKERIGYKAGALSYGLTLTDAEFVAVFDADSLPSSDFLYSVIPYMVAEPEVGIVQTRWSFVNDSYSLLTRVQALALDAHFVVEQSARYHSGLLMHFNGTAGVLRRACIEDSGGWDSDTLSEDMDISLRAQLRGWRCMHLPHVTVPTELPPTMASIKLQQQRWAAGTIQCLRKLGGTLLTSSLSTWQKMQVIMQLCGYLIHPLMILILLINIPLLLIDGANVLSLAPLTLAALGSPTMIAVSQHKLSPTESNKLIYFPFLLLLGFGISLNNTWGVLDGLIGSQVIFRRTPKFNLTSSSDEWSSSSYDLSGDPTIWLEIALTLYALIGLVLAISQRSGMVVILAVYTIGFAFVAGTSIVQTVRWRFQRSNMRYQFRDSQSNAE